MLGEFVTRLLVLVLGYAYPAFECFKALENRTGDVEQLRFWCKYWVIVAMLTVFERLADFFVSWLPMYGELKLAFFIYLWNPKSKGTLFVYNTFLQPFFARHEPDIEHKLQEFRDKSGDLLMVYIKNFTSKGQSMFLELLNYVVSQSPNSSTTETKQRPSSNGPPRPTTIRRSVHHDPLAEAGIYAEPDVIDFNADEDARMEEAVRTTRAKLRRFRDQ